MSPSPTAPDLSLTRVPWHLVQHRPLVGVSVCGPWLEAVAESVQQACTSKRAYVLCQSWWSLEAVGWRIRQQYTDLRSRCPNVAFLYLCNTAEEHRLLREYGMPAVFCNHNCFLDENLIGLRPGVEKRFDAVYNASIALYKRHVLAARIESLALIEGFLDPMNQSDSYIDAIREALAHATWLNRPGQAVDASWVERDQISDLLAMARVGLCLSEVEGAMYASAEYLLTGLPVLTTPNKGGRDVFFEPDFSLIVEPDKDAIAAGVQELARREVSPHEIRERTLAAFRPHRDRYNRVIQEICTREGVTIEPHEGWCGTYRDRLLSWELRRDIEAL